MSVSLTVNGTSFNYPQTRRDTDWAAAASGWAVAMTAVVSHLRAPTPPLADEGVIRLGNGDALGFRNAANDGNITLYVDGSDRLIYDDGSTQKDLSLTGGGNVQNLAAVSDNTVVRFDGVSGALIQESGITIDDSDILTTPGGVVIGSVDVAKALVPIGTVINHYDFNGALVPDATYWVPCDGLTHTVGGVSRTVPDMSGRYVVGFGTDGAGDNNSATWATAAVGNVSHQVDLSHTHSYAHTHGVPASGTLTTGDESAHTHSSGALFACLDFDGGTSQIFMQELTGTFTSTVKIGSVTNDGATSNVRSEGINVGGTSGAGSAHHHSFSVAASTTNSQSSSTTSSSGSAAQSIQPRSIRMRQYMRAA